MRFNVHEVVHGLGAGALLGVVSPRGDLLASLPPELRSAVWGAVGAAVSLVLARGASALGDVMTAAGRRWARRIDPEGAAAAKVGDKPAAPSGGAAETETETER